MPPRAARSPARALRRSTRLAGTDATAPPHSSLGSMLPTALVTPATSDERDMSLVAHLLGSAEQHPVEQHQVCRVRCGICLVESSRVRARGACGHLIDPECWHRYLLSRIHDTAVLAVPCPMQSTAQAGQPGACPRVTEAEFAAACTTEEMGRYRAAAALERLKSDPLTRWCPRPHCEGHCRPPVRLPSLRQRALASVLISSLGAVWCTLGVGWCSYNTYGGRVASFLSLIHLGYLRRPRGPFALWPRGMRMCRCERCEQPVCFECKQEWHEGEPCRDFAIRAVFQALRDRGCRCPRCGHGVERSQGCNHMRCATSQGCGHDFCFLCNSALLPSGQCPNEPGNGGSGNCSMYGGQRRVEDERAALVLQEKVPYAL